MHSNRYFGRVYEVEFYKVSDAFDGWHMKLQNKHEQNDLSSFLLYEKINEAK